MAHAARSMSVVIGFLVLSACGSETEQLLAPTGAPSLQSFAGSDWSEAVHLPDPVNSPANEQNSSFSPHGLSIYVSSNRPGGLGGNDIWVVQRDCLECPWQSPAVNLGPTINNPMGDGGVSISEDGHTMLYQTARAGGFGGTDIWMSHRDDPKDDFAWEPPVNLGPIVNTAEQEQSPEYVVNEKMLYFTRGNIMALRADIWRVPMTRDGEVLGPAEPVSELNSASSNDASATIRGDGRELIFWSFPRAGGPGGGADLFVSTRQSKNEPWGVPVAIPGLANTPTSEVAPTISHDGRTLLFWSDRPGGLGGFDLWVSTRTPSGRD